MRSLEQALIDHELLTLRVIGEWWELDLTGTNKSGAVKALAEALVRVDMQQEMLFLPPEEEAAMRDLVAQGGRAPVAVFSRTHGDVRMMGPGRMEREEPWLDPVSATEALWYRGFIYRGFDETAEELIEFYYIPAELLASFPQARPLEVEEPDISLRPLETLPVEWLESVTDAVDDLTALLAVALQMTLHTEKRADVDHLLLKPDPEIRSLLLTLANEMGLVQRGNDGLRPTRAAVTWLKQGRDAQLFALADAWSNSDWNDLCHTPQLRCEGENWHNDPILARTTLLDALPRTSDWYQIPDLINFIKLINPDFQRPDGNYDTWYIRDANHEGYLAGFDSWDHVEGRLLRYLIQGPLYWLGMVDLAYVSQLEQAAYRLTERALLWLAGQSFSQDNLHLPIVVQADGIILVPQETDRYLRFQVARIADAQPVVKNQPFQYRLTTASLALANDQGIKSDRVLQFLTQASGKSLPKSIQRAVDRWQERGVEARLESIMVLRVNDEAILETLRSNPRTRDYIGESLGELAVAIKPGTWEAFCAATTQLGLFLDSG
jgi:hypothetical protein